MPEANPYESPAEVADSAAATDSKLQYKQTTLANAFFRWSFICIVSAAPSFYLGLAVTQASGPSIIAMLLGVAFYICAYSSIEVRPFWRRWMSTRFVRPSIISAFTIRCVISVLFPVGMINDMVFGMMSMSVGSLGTFFESAPVGRTPGIGTAAAFVVTIVQGLLLSLEVFAVAAVLYGIMVGVNKFKNRRKA